MPEHVHTAIAAVRRVVRCFIYARISEDREGAHLATERQTNDCRELAGRLSDATTEYRIVRVFEDNDLSAYSGKPRPDYKAMLEELRRGEGDCVLAWHTDRLHRSPAELEEYIDVCGPAAIPTRTVKAGDLDLSTATGRMIARQLGVQARYEVERMIERSKRARDQKAQHGEYSGGPRPFGFESDGRTPRTLECPSCGKHGPDGFTDRRHCEGCGADDQFTRDLICKACDSSDTLLVIFACSNCGIDAGFAADSEASLVARETLAVLAGVSLRSLVAENAKHGVVSVHGNEQKENQLRKLLMRPRNAGLMQHRGEIVGRADWMRLVDEPTYRSLVAMLEEPERRSSTTNVRRHLGSRIYVCDECDNGKLKGFPRPVRRGKKKGAGAERGPMEDAYRCENGCVTRDGKGLDDYVVLHVIERLTRPDAADLLARREPSINVSAVQAEMRAARQRLDELATSLGKGEMDMQEWRAAAAPARLRLQAAEEQMKDAVKGNPIAELVAADDILTVWNHQFDLSRRRAAIDYLMEIRVGKARPGRMPDGSYFDKESIRIRWK
ncbi:recombinase family protein [Streptomyces viridochromogenes]|uniref:recombinase family protein n=1 Tax=Streptomyces viridochromogenes TaxID=1938 RepID=UPI00133169B5|nr:recombinase family protein [Streptomyces viridochromogenes]